MTGLTFNKENKMKAIINIFKKQNEALRTKSLVKYENDINKYHAKLKKELKGGKR